MFCTALAPIFHTCCTSLIFVACCIRIAKRLIFYRLVLNHWLAFAADVKHGSQATKEKMKPGFLRHHLRPVLKLPLTSTMVILDLWFPYIYEHFNDDSFIFPWVTIVQCLAQTGGIWKCVLSAGPYITHHTWLIYLPYIGLVEHLLTSIFFRDRTFQSSFPVWENSVTPS